MLKIKTKKKGAELTSIQHNGKEMLFDGKTYWNRQSPILFPIVGQIKNSKTEIEGQIYDKKIYFGLGGHPAFSCDYSTGQ